VGAFSREWEDAWHPLVSQCRSYIDAKINEYKVLYDDTYRYTMINDQE